MTRTSPQEAARPRPWRVLPTKPYARTNNPQRPGYDEATRQKAIERFAAGEDTKTIADDLGVSAITVRRWALADGHDRQPPALDGAALDRRSPARWTASRKLAVLREIRAARLTIDDACRRYGLSAEEIAEWQRRLRDGGSTGLRASVGGRRPTAPRTFANG
jgi:transposase